MWGYEQSDLEKSVDFARKCVETAVPVKEWWCASDGYMMLGIYFTYMSQFDSAMYYYNQAFDAVELSKGIVEESKIDDRISSIYGNLGNLKNYQGKFIEAIDYYYKALRIFEKHDWKESQNVVYINSGELFLSMNNLTKAEQNFLKADSIANLTENPGRIASAKFRLGKVYHILHQYDKALYNLELAYDYFFSSPEEGRLKPAILNHLARVYFWGYENDKKAEEYINMALETPERSYTPSDKAASLQVLSAIYFARSDWKNAEKNALESLKLDDSQPLHNLVLYSILAKVYSYQNKPILASEYINKMNNDQWASQLYQSTLSEMEVIYETEKKEMEIERQQQMIEQQTLERQFLIIGISLIAIILLMLVFLLRLRIRKSRTLSELNNALAETNATKDKFFNIISHDLKNPAISQREAIKLLNNKGLQMDSVALQEFYEELLTSADSQVALLKNLLEWASLQTDKLTCQPIKFDIGQQLSADVELIRKMAENKGISFITKIPSETFVTADASMISTVVRNLLTNAIKFTKEGGNVTLEISPVNDGAQSSTIFSVIDTGLGMSEETLHNIFRIDYHHKTKGTAGETGTGLGLIVCRELLEKHGTQLKVESVAGEGSKFSFVL